MPSGRTVWLRTHNPDGSLIGSASSGQATHTINGVTTGISGRTLAARAAAAMNNALVVPTQAGSVSPVADTGAGVPGGSTVNVTSGGKSGKTLAARAQQTFINNIVHYSIIFGLVVGAIIITKHFVFGVKGKKGFKHHHHHSGGQ